MDGSPCPRCHAAGLVMRKREPVLDCPACGLALDVSIETVNAALANRPEACTAFYDFGEAVWGTELADAIFDALKASRQ